MATIGEPIEAILQLNAGNFHTELTNVSKAVEQFTKAFASKENDLTAFNNAIDNLSINLNEVAPAIARFQAEAKNSDAFNKFANGVKALANAVQILGTDSADATVGLINLMEILKSMQGVFQPSEIHIKGVSSALRELKSTSDTSTNSNRNLGTSFKSLQADLNSMYEGVHRYGTVMTDAEARVIYQTKLMTNEYRNARREMIEFANGGVTAFNEIPVAQQRLLRQTQMMEKEFEKARAELMRFASVGRAEFGTITAPVIQYAEALEVALPPLRSLITGNVELANAEKRVAMASNETSVSLEKESVATNQATASTNRMTSSTNNLKKALSSLRMMGTMVASMLVWNFAHNLLTATNETVNAKSEMEGYFQMLHFGQGQIDNFNKALDDTIKKFPRINKYSLGETISSIGVEFELTTKEMEKAMPVVSMITSEYLRAGRNANEASLAVKDILQGEFQRLSRETGVKGDQLKEAGWSGDKSDVMGLLEALDKVGKSRNWDTFVTKANSLNDAVMIMQNRFGEWSADMVNVVQPTILAVFNSLMSNAESLSQALGGFWKWLNSSGWGQTATKIGMVTTAIMTLMPMITAFRSGSTLLELSSLSLSKQLTALVFGIKAEELALESSSSAIGMKILSLNAEEVAETGVMNVVRAKLLGMEAEKVLTLESTEMNFGFVGSLYALVTGEALAEAETLSFSGALAILTGTFLASPIGWFTLAVLGLASAFYVLSGGLSDSWDKMKQFNEMTQDGSNAMQPYYNRVHDLNVKLEEATEKYGENSSQVKNLQEKLDNAKDSLTNFQDALNTGRYTRQNATRDFEELGASIDDITRGNLKDAHVSKTKIDEVSQQLDALGLGTDKYQKAREVLAKQTGDYESDSKKYIKTLQKQGLTEDEIADKTSNLAQNYENLATHSYIANTSEDWWEWMWNSLYAGIDKFWIDWDKFWTDPQWSSAIDGLWKGLKFGGLGSLTGLLGLDTSKIGEDITNFFNDIGKFFEGKSLMDLLGLDENKDYVGDFLNWLFAPITALGKVDFFGSLSEIITSTLGNIDILGMIWDVLLPDPVSASDGSGSDHPSFMEDVSSILGFDVQSWIDSFNADPLGTLGIQLPQLDVMGLINSILPTGGGENGGGFDIGQWLSDLFNIDGLVSSFITNLSTVVSNATSTASSVGTIFSNLKSTVSGHIQNVVSNVTTGFESVKTNAVSKITAMRDSVGGVITQMTDAWRKMKDSILNSAKLIWDGVSEKFGKVKDTLKDFFTKLQNPSQWGAGFQSMSRSPRPSTARRIVSSVRSGKGLHGAGVNPYRSPNQKVKLQDLLGMVDGNNMVTLSDFLSMFTDGGFGGWSFHEPSKKRIFNTGKEWKSGSPVIKGIGSVGDGYKVKRFWDGTPSFTFEEFQKVAEAIFSQIPYKFYYDSEWKGSWLGALLSGAVNCSDGADALIALASVFGFSGEKVHTTTKSGVGHFFARINGVNMDTTNFQNSRSWSPLGGAGVPTRTSYSSRGARTTSKEVNVHIHMSNNNIYGVDDLEAKIEEGVSRGMREQFNDSYTVVV